MTKNNKKSARAPTLASARIVPKNCLGQLQTIYPECLKFHPNPFTSGGVIVERVNVVQTCHKVFPILGEGSASSLSNERNFISHMPPRHKWNCMLPRFKLHKVHSDLSHVELTYYTSNILILIFFLGIISKLWLRPRHHNATSTS